MCVYTLNTHEHACVSHRYSSEGQAGTNIKVEANVSAGKVLHVLGCRTDTEGNHGAHSGQGKAMCMDWCLVLLCVVPDLNFIIL